jgi:hypothetical protein
LGYDCEDQGWNIIARSLRHLLARPLRIPE